MVSTLRVKPQVRETQGLHCCTLLALSCCNTVPLCDFHLQEGDFHFLVLLEPA